ncbi:hypothetical protein M8J75_008079 [Diaphorina citri]|nr:hypothetical protein M8J75_008079 [Diaphorina citri]
MAELPLNMGGPWTMKIKALLDSVQESVQDKMFPLWLELYGDDKNIINERFDTVQGGVSDLIKEMIREEEENKAEYLMKYDSLLREATTLESELNIVVPQRYEPNESLCVKIHHLELDLEDHRRVRKERMDKLLQFQTEEKALCSKLEQGTQYSVLTTVPSEATLDEIHSYLQSLQAELKKRETKYNAIRMEITQLWSSLQVQPKGSFELQVKENTLADKLGTENLLKLDELKTKLHGVHEAMKAELESLKYQLSTLWTRLDTKASERESFLMKHSKLCTSTIQAYKKEVEVCTALKLKHIVKIVETIREELEDWWNRARVGQPQREMFTEFYLQDNITEEVLEKHEKEVENVKQYYEENRDIFDLLEKRLFKNRGGQLLAEERKRKFIQKELPKLEKHLDKLFDRYEEKNEGQVFLYDGEDARAMIAAQWQERNNAKENKNVVSASQTTAKSKLLGQSVTARHTPGRNNTLKRKGDATPSEPTKRGRLLESAARHPLLPTPVTSSATKRNLAGGSSPASSVLSYSLFTQNITMRKHKRSSSLSKISNPRDDNESLSGLSISSVLKSSLSHESIDNVLLDTPPVGKRCKLCIRPLWGNDNQLDVGTALNSTYDSKKSAPSSEDAPVKSTPKPASKLKLPARSKLLSPKVKARGPTSGRKAAGPAASGLTGGKAPAPAAGLTPRGNATLTRSRSQSHLTPRGNTTLTRSRTQTQLTPHTPRHKLPFIF